MKNKKHVITRTNRAECGAVCQNDRLSAGHIWQTRSHVYGEVKCQAEVRSDVVIPNKLGNGETCQGLRHWRLLSNLKNNFSKPVRNDMDNKNKLDCFAFARNDEKTVKNLFPYFPISLSLKKKIDSSPNALALNGYGFALHPLLVRLRMTAFTLAEVLITLGIIGVVAAITIPGLINNYKANKLRTQFLKSYSTIQQAFKLMQEDDASLDPTTYAQHEFYKSFMKYLKGSTDCGIGDKTDFPCVYTRDYSSATGFKYYKTLNGNSNIVPAYFDDGQIALQDGTLLLFENENRYKGRIFVSIDLNGANNPPNRWGYDLFTFQFIDEELKVMGDVGTNYTDMNKYCNKNSSYNMNGIACAKYAKDNADYFKWVVKNIK